VLALTVAATTAFVCLLVQAAHQQLANMLAQLEPLQQHHAGDSTGVQDALPEQQQQERGSAAADADLAARITSLEAQQQELRELAQRLEAAQQQLAIGDGSSVSLDSQQSSVRDRSVLLAVQQHCRRSQSLGAAHSFPVLQCTCCVVLKFAVLCAPVLCRIQLFEEQLNAAIRRFAPGQLGSRPTSDGGAPGAASDPGGKVRPGQDIAHGWQRIQHSCSKRHRLTDRQSGWCWFDLLLPAL
jgi:hypothetical protein